ncbi:VanZ family protein [Streptomyces sp. NPDC059761]|uniref:VanZ family protein n=1 Tax=Streptomyces sp. NPDC059761 TaxID=3346937 RepID=UPI00364BF515
MIEAALSGHLSLLLLFAALALLAGGPAWWLGRRYAVSPSVAVAAATAGALVLAATLYRLHPQAPASRVCTVQRDVLGSLIAPQGLLNIALFLPLAFFPTLLTRRPLPVFAASAVLSGAIEVTQALTPGMGRACDTGDFAANALGALAGCAAGYVWCRMASRPAAAEARPLRRRADIRLTSFIGAAGAGVLAAVALPTLLITVSDVSDGHRADPAQTKAAAAAAREFFGDSVTTDNVQYTPGSHGQPGRLEVATRAGSLVVDWPSREVRSGRLAAVEPDRPDTSPIADAAVREAASAFAKSHFPWAPSADTTQVTAAGGPDSQARLVSWRSRVDGVLMPMRLDVIVGGDQRILAFSATNIAAPQLPKPVVTKEEAQNKAEAALPGAEVTSSELIAKQDAQGAWRVCWITSLKSATPAGGPSAPGPGATARPKEGMRVFTLDAVTGLPFQGKDPAPASG